MGTTKPISGNATDIKMNLNGVFSFCSCEGNPFVIDSLRNVKIRNQGV